MQEVGIFGVEPLLYLNIHSSLPIYDIDVINNHRLFAYKLPHQRNLADNDPFVLYST